MVRLRAVVGIASLATGAAAAETYPLAPPEIASTSPEFADHHHHAAQWQTDRVRSSIEDCGTPKLQICFTQDVSASYLNVLPNLRDNLTALVTRLALRYPQSQFALGTFEDHGSLIRNPFALNTPMTTADAFNNVVVRTFGSDPQVADISRRDRGPASYFIDQAGEAALDAAYFCARDAGFVDDPNTLKLIIAVTDALPRLPYRVDGSVDQAQILVNARLALGNPTFNFQPWTSDISYTADRFADWISTDSLQLALRQRGIQYYVMGGIDVDGYNPQVGWQVALRRMGQGDTHYTSLIDSLANIRQPVQEAVLRAVCEYTAAATSTPVLGTAAPATTTCSTTLPLTSTTTSLLSATTPCPTSAPSTTSSSGLGATAPTTTTTTSSSTTTRCPCATSSTTTTTTTTTSRLSATLSSSTTTPCACATAPCPAILSRSQILFENAEAN